jgi:hypothetical protein
VRAGFQADCNNDACRIEEVRIVELVIRKTARGAERARDLMESMMDVFKGVFIAGCVGEKA